MINKPIISFLLLLSSPCDSVFGLNLRRDIHQQQLDDDSMLLQTSSELNLEASAQSQLQARLQELIEDEQLIDLSQFNREDQFDNLLELDDHQACKATDPKSAFIWKNYLQTDSDVGQQSYQYNEADNSIRLQDGVLRASARKAEELLLGRLRKQQSLAQTINENEDFKLQMTLELKKLEQVLNKRTEQMTKMRYIQKNIADANTAIDDLKQE